MIKAAQTSGKCTLLLLPVANRLFGSTTSAPLQYVPRLTNWELDSFRKTAFEPSKPAQLPRSAANLPPACISWFEHDQSHDAILQSFGSGDLTINACQLRQSFWSRYEDTPVPLELTSTDEQGQVVFHRSDAPLKLLLTYLDNQGSEPCPSTQRASIYLAQCDLRDLPESLQRDIPTPELVLRAGQGDIYSTSLWMGRSPTYTPLHRDPNPNLFMQIAGRKVVRLFEPGIGKELFEFVQSRLRSGNDGSSDRFRGEEMMVGQERALLHDLVWGYSEGYDTGSHDVNGDLESDRQQTLQHCHEASLDMGEALFIPKGWWHSVKGVGNGVTASVNWWFR